MDRYLANIDRYMEQRQKQEALLSYSEEPLTQQQQQQQEEHKQMEYEVSHTSPTSDNYMMPLNDDIWLQHMSNISYVPSTPSIYSSDLLMGNESPLPVTINPSLDLFHSNMDQSAEIYQSAHNVSSLLSPSVRSTSFSEQEKGGTTRVRKKPGRKPNPASPALRKAQNRAAQRAFRERKEKHLHELEGTIRNLHEQHNHITKELNEARKQLETYRTETWYLRGIVLSLQFLCMFHHIKVPAHAPYLSEEALSEMAHVSPEAIEKYISTYSLNNIHLESTMAYHFDYPLSNEHKGQEREDTTADQKTVDTEMDENYNTKCQSTTVSDDFVTPILLQNENSTMEWSKLSPSETSETTKETNVSSSLAAIQQIRLKLGVQSALSDLDPSSLRLKPTILQLAIPHDPRIDLVPTPHMRDRMIVFREMMDYDRCFALLLNEAVYHGGDPTMSKNWELPPDFFSEFWYLVLEYDIDRTNAWRRRKGLDEVEAGTTMANSSSGGKSFESVGNDSLEDFLDEIPPLQPFTIKDGEVVSDPAYTSTPAGNALSENISNPHDLYRKFLMTSPRTRQRLEIASIENIIGLIKSL
ncbi:hypothetical protein BDB01DRAFT_848232 [Pilobolus umbonatus]|nr:hypothetical protein BDB01DRAFT_848232 [Pilobolus umbonatus]